MNLKETIMADYWVSRERHYCKFCNVWMQSDKLSIKHHEQGRKHKDKVEETLKHKRQAKSDANNAQKELQDQLKEIEEVAQAKYELDMAKRRAPPPPPRKPGQAPPPPPRRPGRSSGNAVNTAVATPTTTSAIVPSSKPPNRGQYHHPIQQEAELEDEEEEEDSNGVYAVRGIVYLEGKKHDSQLETGSACQIWVEEAEQWIDALVEQATVHTVPNTELSFRRFSVMYMLPPSEEAEQKGEKAQPMTEREVLADRLRIPLPLNVTLEAAEKMVEQWRNGGDATQGEAIPNVMIDETTGMGEWSTVEVRQIDESPEAVAKRAAEAEAEAEHLAEEQKRLDALEDFSGQGDNALGAFNPWGGSYKGVNLDDGSAAPADGSSASAPKREEEINISTNGNVSFKKRGQKKQKRRRIHTDDE
ncbi:Zinc finger protein ZOP1 [Phytophthora citrophthora]|uniref:Zinc finger protein ZOP1 n=1 Tax=Phytophthora citrophthora TaxID=4793 RepID=A0AAD9GNM9_9STRA|nr:Zinc finger protein ZOP1 [Phytophthora citrophthora]KAK1941950.1 Zinc finger protein ZOP1 [Phytophthora citrophthora]